MVQNDGLAMSSSARMLKLSAGKHSTFLSFPHCSSVHVLQRGKEK